MKKIVHSANIGSNKYPIMIENENLRENVPDIDKYFKSAKKECNNIPKVNNVIVDEKYIENVDCPVCDSNLYKQLLVKRGFVYVVCNICTHVYLRNRMSEKSILKLYSESEVDVFDRKTHESPYHVKYWQAIYRKYLDLLPTTEGSLIDIGSGDGRFLQYCKNNTTLTLYANDFCSDNYNYIVDLVGAKKYFYGQSVCDVDFKSKVFKIITMWGVLEHLTNPREIMKKCFEIMDNKSRLLVLIPNIYSRAFKILGAEVPTLNPRQHLNFYTSDSMKYLCDKEGFKIIEEYQELPIIDLMYPYIDRYSNIVDEILEADESYYKVYILGINEDVRSGLNE